ncbi:CpsD/CapB family tyrosine-protein kinase [Lactonifactor longoviformis]|uniref:CpsD/CapB family tyrosine-protein kinase n=1 Tax=Lactonifactor longoviformis TaxID=341220 RepID=UPI0036F400E3
MEKLEIRDDVELSNREKEVYRTLRTNLEFTGVENRAIAVTSCTPNDGKSVVSYNLSLALAESGKNTLFVDADLRKSVLVHRLNLKNPSKGLSHLLSGQVGANDVIYSTNKKNLFMIPSGIFPSNPTELLSNGRFEKLVAGLKGTFDYIVVDTPPLGSVIDAAVIAKICDGSVLVLAADKSSRNEAKSVVGQLKAANSNVLGVVLNKVDYKGNGYYGKKYGGYYGKYTSYY